jgi:hypothetical protein
VLAEGFSKQTGELQPVPDLTRQVEENRLLR